MKEIYQHMNEQIQPDDILIQKVLHQSVRKKSRAKKVIAVGFACAVLGTGSLTLLTHASEDFRNMLWQISPRAGAVFSPVMKSSVNNGIKMTVEGVYIDNDDTEFYITFQDLEENRIDKNLDLFDSYTIIRPFAFDGSAYGCAKESFDEETGKVRFHIYTHEPGAGNFWGDAIAFSVKTLMYGVQTAENVPVDIDLTQVNYRPATTPGKEFFQNRGYSGGGKYIPNPEEISIIKPEYQKEFLGEIRLTGLAWENGWLHIQNYVENWNGNTAIGYYLIDENGNEIEEEFSLNWHDSNGEYMETFLKVDSSEIQNYQVYADYRIGGKFIDGNWQVKFPLENTE